MTRSLLFIVLILLTFSCSRKIPPTITTTKPVIKKPLAIKKETKTAPQKHVVAAKALPAAKVETTYQSTGNDVANITIHLTSDKKFDFHLTIKPKEGGQKDERIMMRGSWKRAVNRTILIFDRKDVDLNALFDKTFSTDTEFEILDAHQVAINSQLGVIHIWGVACEKK